MSAGDPAEIVGGLAHLPVAVVHGAIDGGLDLGITEERGERQYCSPSHRRLVRACCDDRVDRPLVADRSQRRNGGFAHERLCRCRSEFDQSLDDRFAGRFVFAARPGGDLDDAIIAVVQRTEQIDVSMRRRNFGATTSHGHLDVGERRGDLFIIESPESLERTERRCSYVGVVGGQPGERDRHIAAMPGDRHLAPRRLRRGGHDLSRSVSVITA